jgi:hypothetical protein
MMVEDFLDIRCDSPHIIICSLAHAYKDIARYASRPERDKPPVGNEGEDLWDATAAKGLGTPKEARQEPAPKAVAPDEKLEPSAEHLPRAQKLAYAGFKIAEIRLGKEPADRQAYDYLKKNWEFLDLELLRDQAEGPGTYDAWSRALRRARNELGEPKHRYPGNRAHKSANRTRSDEGRK